MGVRPFKAAHRAVIAALGCVVVPDASGFHAKNPYHAVPQSVLQDAAQWTRLVVALTDADTLAQQRKKKEARNQARARAHAKGGKGR